MSLIKCPKCGKEQPSENVECIQCGVIFKKLSQHHDIPIHPQPPPEPTPIHRSKFLPPVGLKSNLEITILNIFAYIYLILGVGAGIGIIFQGKDEMSFLTGIRVIGVDLVTAMLLFVICTVAKRIISIDSNILSLKDIISSKL